MAQRRADAPLRRWLPPTGIDHGRSGLHFTPRPSAECEIVVAVFGGLFVLELMAVEKPTLAMGQGAVFDGLFQRVDVCGLQHQLTAVEVVGV